MASRMLADAVLERTWPGPGLPSPPAASPCAPRWRLSASSLRRASVTSVSMAKAPAKRAVFDEGRGGGAEPDDAAVLVAEAELDSFAATRPPAATRPRGRARGPPRERSRTRCGPRAPPCRSRACPRDAGSRTRHSPSPSRCQMPSWAVSTMRRKRAWLRTSSAPRASARAAASIARADARRRVSLMTLIAIPVTAKSSEAQGVAGGGDGQDGVAAGRRACGRRRAEASVAKRPGPDAADPRARRHRQDEQREGHVGAEDGLQQPDGRARPPPRTRGPPRRRPAAARPRVHDGRCASRPPEQTSPDPGYGGFPGPGRERALSDAAGDGLRELRRARGPAQVAGELLALAEHRVAPRCARGRRPRARRGGRASWPRRG